jgi:hypothetical protein
MVDWGLRTVKLLPDSANDGGNITVDRKMQVQALRPHILLIPGSDEVGTGRFTREEASIRDHYDTMLDGFERFGNYLKTKLVRVDNMEPYLGYWINDIHAESENLADAAWTAALLTYIQFYGFYGVQYLFQAFGKEIGPDSEAYRRALAKMEDQDLAARLAASLRKN